MLHDLAQVIGLNRLIYSRLEPWVKTVSAMIIGRIVYAGSKLSLSRTPAYSCLWEICAGHDGHRPVDVNLCYSAMDELLERQDLIQKKLAKRHLTDNSIVLYDITSSYFEGEHENSELVHFGYNRDKKRGEKQVVIGLICANDGCPISVEVFPATPTTQARSTLRLLKYRVNMAFRIWFLSATAVCLRKPTWTQTPMFPR
jgi:hypothetical protein